MPERPLWTAQELLAATAGALHGDVKVPLNGVSIDTRTVAPGDIFIALKGESRDGHDFVPQALRAGAGLAVVSHVTDEMKSAGALLEVSQDPLRGLEAMGRASRAWNKGKKNVGVLGFSFKAGTDDLRESPIVMLIESLIGKGYKLKVYDTNVNLAKLFGANKEYIEKHIEHISSLMTTSIEELVSFADIIVIGNKSDEFKKVLAMLTERHDVIDLVRIEKDVKTKARYEGLCW